MPKTLTNISKIEYTKTKNKDLYMAKKAKKLHFIKDYMYTEKAGYDIGRHIVDEIGKNTPKE